MTERQSIKQYLLHIAIIGVFSILVMGSSFYRGVTTGNDFVQHFQFAETIYNTIISGEFYPSWAGAPNNGYGDAAIRFYPPLAYYLWSASYIAVGDWYDATLLTFFLIFWAGGVGIYFWAKEEFSGNQSLLAAGLYVFAPYHVNEIYNNFLYAEFAASALIPFCFLFVTRVCRKGKSGDVVGLSISYALLILTHLPLLIISSLVLFIYAASLLRKDSFLKTLPKLAVSVTAAVCAGSFYWIRMVTELAWVRHSSEAYFLQIYDYRNNFLLAPQNILNFQTDISVLWFADLMLLAMLLVSIPSIVLLVKNRRSVSGFSISTALIFVISILMATPASKMVWENLIFLQKTQFPWRWLGIVSMSGAVFSSIGIIRAAELMNINKNHLLSVALGLILIFYAFMSAFVIKQAVYVPREDFTQQVESIQSTTSFDCWWTIWAKSEAFQVKEKLVAENRATQILRWDTTEKEFDVTAGQTPSIVRVAAFYYPHWQAIINNEPARVEIAADGAVLIPLPKDSAHVRISFREPYFVKIANVVSLTIWIFFIFIGCILAYKKFTA